MAIGTPTSPDTGYIIAFLKTHLENKVGYGNVLTPGWSINVESNADYFASSRGNYQAVFLGNACLKRDGDFKYFLRQPGITTNNASTDRDENMFTTEGVFGQDMDGDTVIESE